MTVQDYEAKIKQAEEKIAKIKSTLDRHSAAKDKKVIELNKLLENSGLGFLYDDIEDKENWALSPQIRSRSDFEELYLADVYVQRKVKDIESTKKKLAEAEKALEKLQASLKEAKLKEQYIEDEIPKVIKDFMLDWKKSIFDWIVSLKDEYDKDRDSINKAYYEFILDHESLFSNSPYITIDDYMPNKNYRNLVLSSRAYKEARGDSKLLKIEEDFSNKYSFPLFKIYKQHDFDDKFLDKELTKEMNNRLLDLMNRVGKITGKILNADLYVNYDDLNGTIYGEDGKASVNTISAGGYAIQRWHLRVLVKEIK